MLKKNILLVFILFIISAALYYFLFSFMGSEELAKEEDSSVIFLTISVALSLVITSGSLSMSMIVSLFFRKTIESWKNFYDKKFRIVFFIGWFSSVLISLSLGIST